MNVSKYKAKSDITILNFLFFKDDEFYATPSFHVMNGRFGYARKIYALDKAYLGMIDDDNFPEKSVERIIN